MSSPRLRSFVHESVVRADGGGADFETGTVPAIISTDSIARDHARIEQAGWDFTNYRKNPTVLFGHDDGAGSMFGPGSRALPIARSSDEMVQGDRTTAIAHFDMEDDFARQVLGKIQRGLISSTSVRWLPTKTRVEKMRGEDGKDSNVLVFERQELLEWSFVSIPADPGATVMREDGRALALEDFGAGDLMSVLERAHELLTPQPADARGIAWTPFLTDDEQAAAARLYDAIAARVEVAKPLPSTATDEIAATLDALTSALRGVAQAVVEMRTRRAPDTQRIVAEAIAHATGHTVESVQTKLRSGT